MIKRGILALLTSFVAMQTYAQVTTSSVGGIVTANGKTVENAQIELTLTTTNAKYKTESRVEGVYDVYNLQAGGPYSMLVSAPGQKSVTINGIYLVLGENYKLDVDVNLAVESMDGVQITASRNSGTKTGSNFNISNKTLSTLPTINRSINDFTKFTPQAGANSSFNGRDGRFNNITIDGANFNNNFGLSTNNLPGGDAQPISLDAIEAIQVNVSPYDVRQSNFTGAGINAITRSGSNTTTGSVYTFYRNEKFNGTKVGDQEITSTNKLTSNIFGFRVGGAIVKNKLFYFANFESENISYPGLTWEATNANSNTSNTNLSRVLESDLTTVRNHLKSKYDYETGDFQNLGNFTTSNYKFLARVDWNISDKHKLSARYNYVQNTNDQITNGTSAPNPRSASNRWSNNAMSYENSLYSFLNTVGSLSLELKSNLNKKMSNQLLVTTTNVVDTRKSGSDAFPFVDIKKGGDQYISFGYELFSWNNEVKNNTYSLIDNFTYNLKKHTITAGIAFDYMYVSNSFLRYGTGYYRYDSLSQFLNDQQPSAYAVTYGYNGEKNPTAELAFGQAAAYVQDEFRLNNRLKLVGGLRIDAPIYFSEPLANKGFSKYTDSTIFKTPENEGFKYDPSVWPSTAILFSPRIGVNYDVLGNKSLVVRGGTGIFTGRLPFVWYTNQPTNAYGLQATVEYTKKADLDKYGITNFNQDPGAYVSNLPQEAGSLPNGASFAMVDPEFKFPQIWRTSVGVDYKLPWGFDFSADLIFSQSLNDIYQYDANMRPSDTVYYKGTEYRMAGYTNAAARTYDASVRNAIVMTNTNQGRGFSAAATLSKNFKNGLNFFVSYAFNDTRDITANPGSQANSAWTNNTNFNQEIGQNQNTPNLSYSQYATPHRIVGAVSYKIEYAKHFATTISLTYEGSNAGRFSYVYSTDMNNDGISNNDLLYVHNNDKLKFKDMVVSGKTITAEEQATAWTNYVNQDPYLSKNKGDLTERFAAKLPWLHRFDLSIYQDIVQKVGNTNHRLQLSANVLNIGNMINSNWGISQRLNVNNGAILKYNSADKTFNMATVNGVLPTTTFVNNVTTASTWAMQLGVRYLF
jgi:hypothetical protein